MIDGDDDLLFGDDPEPEAKAAEAASDPAAEAASDPACGSGKPWMILIVDDDPEVHTITRIVLRKLSFNGRSVQCLGAYSAAEARTILRTTPDIALILLDVVMETEDAGLLLVSYIREDIGNAAVRIILRTGQPGQAPEDEVIHRYDINDYKAKTELTAQKLMTTAVAALRSYEHICALEMNRRGLEKIVEASSTLFQQRSLALFASGVLTQLCALLGVPEDGLLCAQRGDAAGRNPDEVYVLAGLGIYQDAINHPVASRPNGTIAHAISETLRQRRNLYHADYTTLYLRTANRRDAAVYIHTGRPLSELDRRLVEVLCDKISVAFDNLHLYEQLANAHIATMMVLADLAEHRDQGAGTHVLRIAHLAEAMLRELRATGRFAERVDDTLMQHIGMASMLHDVGMFGIPDSVLTKPGPLDPQEIAAVRRHPAAGAALLEKAERQIEGASYLDLAVEIALRHHERYDGTGYPQGLAGEDIPLAARIVAVADVFDALVHDRPHRTAWPVDRAIAFIRDNAGTQFDPAVVEAFLAIQER